ncbi:MAG TPA: ATP-dependent 6-phosphofructokinase [Gemmatimonadaceae bacterium]|nr:ATP-dependent 6-phosphofructokinase [Gemmatimonadaceae bacterium]
MPGLKFGGVIPGIALCAAIAAVAWVLQGAYVDAIVLAIVLGAVVRTVWKPGDRWLPGIRISGHFLLEVAVVLLGASVDAALVARAGPRLLGGVVVIVAVTLVLGYAAGRALGLHHRLALLVATGNAICGNSAIAAIAPVIDADGDDVAASIAFTAVLGVAAVLGLPALGRALGLTEIQYGALAGLTVYAVPQVLAATLPVSAASAQIGTIVKLTRVLMLGPVVIALSLARGGKRPGMHRLVPWFVVGFVLMGVARTAGLLPAWLPVPLRTVATMLTVLSMAALGLAVDVRALARVGGRVIASVIAALAILLGSSLVLVQHSEMRVALSTGGGDAPGLNAVIRAAVLAAVNRDWEVLGIKRGFAGLLGEDDVVALTRESVRGIGHLGGTILHTTNRGNPLKYERAGITTDRSDELIANARNLGIDAVITIGGDGSLAIAQRLHEKGLHVIGVPKTIDNDVSGTVTTFGFDTAVNTAIEAVDRLHTTAESHDRVIVMEVMGRHAGFIALHTGLAASADVILIPEIPYDIDSVCEKVRERDRAGRLFSIIVVAEGAYPTGGSATTSVGGVAGPLARLIQEKTGKETRWLVLGHLQRGGMPTGYDRLLATRFGGAAVRAVADGKWGHMVALQSPRIVTIPIEQVLAQPKRVDPRSDTVLTAREMGISFGD